MATLSPMHIATMQRFLDFTITHRIQKLLFLQHQVAVFVGLCAQTLEQINGQHGGHFPAKLVQDARHFFRVNLPRVVGIGQHKHVVKRNPLHQFPLLRPHSHNAPMHESALAAELRPSNNHDANGQAAHDAKIYSKVEITDTRRADKRQNVQVYQIKMGQEVHKDGGPGHINDKRQAAIDLCKCDENGADLEYVSPDRTVFFPFVL
jgi:hypothetical protein